MDGVVVVDKPAGMTSHDVVNGLRRLYGTRRIGHAGTLDPLATGVLVACIGQATRIAEYLSATSKEYLAGALLGLETDTEDVSGHVVAERDASDLDEAAVRGALARFRGAILQTPPMVSAVHHEGRRLHDLARQGLVVERQARPVEVAALELLSFTPGRRASGTLHVECSAGTYVRTLIADLGAVLGVGGAMESLARTRAGAFRLDQARTLDELAELAGQDRLPETLLPVSQALQGWPEVMLDPEGAARARNGQAVRGSAPDGLVLMLDAERQAVAIGRAGHGLVAPVKVFADHESGGMRAAATNLSG